MPRKLALKLHLSLDGYMVGPNGDLDWVMSNFDAAISEQEVSDLWQAGLHVMGRGVFQAMEHYWPASTEPYAPPMNEIPKLIFSQSVKSTAWHGARLSAGDAATELRELKREEGREILAHGGAKFAQMLVRENMVDEFRLYIHPIALGGGLPFAITRAKLKLLLSRAYGCGVVLLKYALAQ